MVARIKTIAFNGINALDIDIQVRLSQGLPSFQIVGLADKAVGESRDRIRNAIESLGFSMPMQRITVNLSPADLVKEGSHYDLPIALAVLLAMEVLPAESLHDLYALGELNLDGKIAPTAGILVAAIHALQNNARFICPEVQASEAIWAGENLQFIAANNLGELIAYLSGNATFQRPSPKIHELQPDFSLDLADIRGQETAKRALEVAAAGGLNLLMIGPAGSGKSMLASRMPPLLPPMLPREALETTMIHSLAGKAIEGGIINQRPFRDPHHSASIPALTGGGPKASPGEISLAHNGVLFLDELPEFQSRVLDSLRQPLETGSISIARAAAHVNWPARFQLIAAMNPCRCGHLQDPSRSCTRAPRCGEEYQKRLSGPLLDRFDIIIDVPAVPIKNLFLPKAKEGSAQVRQRTLAARRIQWKRYKNENYYTNGAASSQMIEIHAMPQKSTLNKFQSIMETKGYSARGLHRILKVARTIADLEASAMVQEHHLSEALQLRSALMT